MEKMINALIEERGLTLTELTARLGYQSKTSLVRIMKNQASQRALDAFVRRLNACMELNEQERERLNAVLECLRWQEDYASSQEMLSFLRGEQCQDAEVTLEEVGSGSCALLSERYANAAEIRITLLNCQYVPVFKPLLNMVRHQGAQIEHFLMMREDSARVIRAINALIPLIYEKGYTGYSYRNGEATRMRSAQGVLCADLMLVQYRSEAGELCEDWIVFDDERHGLVHAESCPGFGGRMLGIRREEFEPIKNVYFQNVGMESYVQFCSEYAQLEYNRSIYKIKPDVGLEWIPEDILVAALEEGGALDIGQMGELIEAFREVYHERVRNAYEKRRVSRLIMKRSAMARFARTGRLSDHFWAMRSFTQEERLRVLRLLKDQMENGAYFHIYFLKDNDFLRDAEIACYDGVGIRVMDANTDYALAGNHSEVMIVHDGFMRMFREYFERSLLADQVMPHSEAVDFMDELIRIASERE